LAFGLPVLGHFHHNINVDEAKLLCEEKLLYLGQIDTFQRIHNRHLSKKRPQIIREAIEIEKNKDNINKDDSSSLSNSWKRVLRGETERGRNSSQTPVT
jgi:hypothetical protein